MTLLPTDLRLAWRSLGRSPGFTVAAVLTLALGLGGNLAMFSVANALFLRPLPLIDAPDRLVWIQGTERETMRPHAVSYPDARDLASLGDVFSGVAAQARLELNVAGTAAPARLPGAVVSANFFSVLGVRPALGRTFLPEEERERGAHPVAVVSDATWRRELGGDPAAIGKSIIINARPFTVVGVLPPSFIGTEFSEKVAEVYLPASMVDGVATQFSNALDERELWAFSVIGRLRAGVSLERARAAVQTLAASRDNSDAARDGRLTFVLQPMSGSLHPNERTEGLTTGALGLGIAGVVLLIACANIAALLLGRIAGRRREMAIRLAMGAGRWRLVRQLLAENLVLAAIATGVGLLLAAWTTSGALAALGVPIAVDVSPDWRITLAAAGLAVVSAVLFGIVPALAASRTALAPALSDGAAAAGLSRSRRRLQRAFVGAQVALSLMLLASGALLLRSMRAVTKADAGFEMTDRVLTASFDLAAQGYTAERARAITDQLLERVSALPGVRTATIAGLVPLGGVMWGTQAQVEVPGTRPRTIGLVFMNPVRPAFFRATGMRLAAGRDFSLADDRGAPLVAVVGEEVARTAWPGENAIGRRFRLGGDEAPWATVVGVAGDAVDGPGERPQPFVYLPLLQQRAWRLPQALIVRADVPAAPLAPAVAAEVRRLDPSLPVFHVATLRDIARERLMPRRAGSIVVGVFGLLALGLAAIGLYGVVSYTMLQRRREMGVRMALGATGHDIVGLVLREGVRVAATGLVAGLALAAGATTLLASMFVTVGVLDPGTWALSASVVVGTVLVASLLPALRAARLDPVATLRNE